MTRTLAKTPRIDQSPVALGLRQAADQMFARASGARLREGNCVRLLKDATENYPRWLDAIASARRTIHFEMYIIHEDDQGRLFSDALIAKAKEGVRVRLMYDWLGGFGKTSRAFWNRLRAGGIEVRCYNPPRFDSPFGWVSRDHRKTISVDRQIASAAWLAATLFSRGLTLLRERNRHRRADPAAVSSDRRQDPGRDPSADAQR